MTVFAEWLDSLNQVVRQRARQQPWLRVNDDTLRQRIERRHGVAPKTDPRPGEVLLLGYLSGDPSGALIALRPTKAQNAPHLRMDAMANATLDVATNAVAVSHVPMLNPAALQGTAWTLEPIYSRQELEAADGPSFGLAMALAVASRLLDLPVPADVAATGCIASDGTVSRVDDEGLRIKVQTVSTFALGVQRLLVPASQAELAASANVRPDLEIIGVSTVQEAHKKVFPSELVESHLRERLGADRGGAVRVSQELYRLSLEPAAPLLGWRGVAAAADHAAKALRDGEDLACRRAEIAHDIARRHEGEPALMAIPDDLTVLEPQRERRAVLIAHVVQSAADSDDLTTVRYVEWARSLVPPPHERIANDLKVLGAIGRGLSQAGRPDEAIPVLQEAVDAWLQREEPWEASHPASALAYAYALLPELDVAKLNAFEDERWRPVHDAARTSNASRAFLRVALASAYARREDVEKVRTLLSESELDWSATPAHARQARLRWLARAIPTDAAKHIETLSHAGAGSDGTATAPAEGWLLARIERASRCDAAPDTWDALEEETLQHPDLGPWLQRYTPRAKHDDAQHRCLALAWWYPY